MHISDVDFLNKIKKRDSTFFMDGKSVEDVLFCSNKPKVSVAAGVKTYEDYFIGEEKRIE